MVQGQDYKDYKNYKDYKDYTMDVQNFPTKFSQFLGVAKDVWRCRDESFSY